MDSEVLDTQYCLSELKSLKQFGFSFKNDAVKIWN